MFGVSRNGQIVAQFSTMEQCAAEILVRGWFEPIERHGVVWKKGVEIIPVKTIAHDRMD